LFPRHYINECEERYGVEEVERLLDSCHALMNYGVDRYKRPQKISLVEETARQKSREEYLQSQVNSLWKTLPRKDREEAPVQAQRYPNEPQENILYFMEKNAPLLESWQREILRIVRKVSQYFYPQKQTQVMNEGWATFWHYTILNHLYDEGRVTDRFMMEFLHSHTNVVYQPPYNSPYYNGINPYALGFAMFQDIKQICQSPTEEDYYWFPDIAGKDWLDTLHFAMRDFKDESFISQFLSPKIMRDFRLFTVLDDDKNNYLEISAIHNEEGYRTIRNQLSAQYNLSNHEPNIQVWNVDLRGDRSLTLRYIPHDRAPLDKSRQQVMKHIHRLWGFDVHMEQLNDDGSIDLLDSIPQKTSKI
uniref:SpoVR family protein n=1 Tax=Yersinia pestis TaxID=632 RepID=UPI0005787936